MTTVRITNNNISNLDAITSLVYSNYAAISTSDECFIENNVIKGRYDKGIACKRDAVIVNNKLSFSSGKDASHGILIDAEQAGSTVIENNIIEGSLRDEDSFGIRCHYFNANSTVSNSSFLINNNKIDSQCSYGIYCRSNLSSSINGNKITNFTSGGIYFNIGNAQSNIIRTNNSVGYLFGIGCANQELANSEEKHSIVADNIFQNLESINFITGTSSSRQVMFVKSWVIERNAPNYTTLSQQSSSQQSSSQQSSSQQSLGASSLFVENLSYLIQPDQNHIIWYKFDDEDTSGQVSEKIIKNIVAENISLQNPISPNGSGTNLTIYTNGDQPINNNYTRPSNIVFRSNIFSNAKRSLLFNCYGDSKGNNFEFQNFVQNGITLEASFKFDDPFFYLSNGQEFTWLFGVNRLGNTQRKIGLGFRRFVPLYTGDNSPKNVCPVFRYDTEASSSIVGDNGQYYYFGNSINIHKPNHLMVTVKRLNAQICDIKMYHNGFKLLNNSSSAVNFFFKNANGDPILNEMDIFFGSGKVIDSNLSVSGSNSKKGFYGGVSDLRISNIVRDDAYALKAYQDLLSLGS